MYACVDYAKISSKSQGVYKIYHISIDFRMNYLNIYFLKNY